MKKAFATVLFVVLSLLLADLYFARPVDHDGFATEVNCDAVWPYVTVFSQAGLLHAHFIQPYLCELVEFDAYVVVDRMMMPMTGWRGPAWIRYFDNPGGEP